MGFEDHEFGDSGFADSGFDSGFGSGFGDGDSATATVVRPSKVQPVRETEQEEPQFWHVVLLDDDEHTYDYVIRLLMEVFSQPVERAFETAKKVDEAGRAVLLTTHKEHAELKLEQVQSFGKDELIASCSGAMSAVLEPACYAGDDDG